MEGFGAPTVLVTTSPCKGRIPLSIRYMVVSFWLAKITKKTPVLLRSRHHVILLRFRDTRLSSVVVSGSCGQGPRTPALYIRIYIPTCLYIYTSSYTRTLCKEFDIYIYIYVHISICIVLAHSFFTRYLRRHVCLPHLSF